MALSDRGLGLQVPRLLATSVPREKLLYSLVNAQPHKGDSHLSSPAWAPVTHCRGALADTQTHHLHPLDEVTAHRVNS